MQTQNWRDVVTRTAWWKLIEMNILIAKDESHYDRLEKFNQPKKLLKSNYNSSLFYN